MGDMALRSSPICQNVLTHWQRRASHVEMFGYGAARFIRSRETPHTLHVYADEREPLFCKALD